MYARRVQVLLITSTISLAAAVAASAVSFTPVKHSINDWQGRHETPKVAPPQPIYTPPGGRDGMDAFKVQNFSDPTGVITSINVHGSIASSSPFFMPLGTNGRTCASCHQPSQGWSITPAQVQARFNATQGTDPIFALVDGANSPLEDVSTLAARQSAYSELLNKAVIRIGRPIPTNAQFTLSAVDDPYGFASASELSLFRRPLPSTNLRFLSAVMWDGRETIAGNTFSQDLMQQASDAVLEHEQAGVALTTAQKEAILYFEGGLYTAQIFDINAGNLYQGGANGDPFPLADLSFTFGGNNPASPSFNPNVFDLYTAWSANTAPTSILSAQTIAARQSVQRGQTIFNNRLFTISNVPGFNDVIQKPSIQGSCSSCHSTPDMGNSSTTMFMDTGLTVPQRRTPDQPLYTFENTLTLQTRQVTDPGFALTTGNWADISKFKVPVLRGLAGRAPYFHDGSAPDLNHVLGFYNKRFNIGFSPQDQQDLVNFLNTL